MNNEDKFILFMCLCKHLTIILHSSLHPALVAAMFREVPYTSSFSFFFPPPSCFVTGNASTFVVKDGGLGTSVLPVWGLSLEPCQLLCSRERPTHSLQLFIQIQGSKGSWLKRENELGLYLQNKSFHVKMAHLVCHLGWMKTFMRKSWLSSQTTLGGLWQKHQRL